MTRPDFNALSSRELAPYIQHTKFSVGITRDEIVDVAEFLAARPLTVVALGEASRSGLVASPPAVRTA